MSGAGRAGVFGAVLAMLWAAHDLADHVVQTDHQAAHKAAPGRAGWSAMAGHVGSYTAVQVLALAALRPLGVRPSLRRTAAAVGFSASTHALLDRRWLVRAVLTAAGAPKFAAMTTPVCGGYQADQALHHAALTVSALLLSAPAPRIRRRRPARR
jgi:hypothetical protein